MKVCIIDNDYPPMCTVTFIPQNNNKFILTSNRDEAPDRKTLPPQQYDHDGISLLFPKDEVAGGTWIGLSGRDRLICLLNGGFTVHERQDSYRLSRGIIVKDLLLAPDVIHAIESYDFNGIEPFTVILVTFESHTQVYELVWDGQEPHLAEKPLVPQIWSSALLYTPPMKQLRETWFSEFMFDNLRPSPEEILNFHTTAGNGDSETDLVMDRTFVKTRSITQVRKTDDRVTMHYHDLEENLLTESTL